MNLIRRLKFRFLRKKEIATMLQESGLSDKLANGDSEAWMTYIFLLERADASWRVSPALMVAIGGPTYGSNDEFHESSPIHLS